MASAPMVATALQRPALIADIGGTNARFALTDLASAQPDMHAVQTLPCGEYASLQHAAEAYLARTAINQTISYLRAIGAIQRTAVLVSWEELLEEREETKPKAKASPAPRKKLTERELIEVLEHCLDGPNGGRDILIFLLYAYDGYSAPEIAGMGVCNLKESSISNLVRKTKASLRKYLLGEV